MFSTGTSPQPPFASCLVNSPYSHSMKDFVQLCLIISPWNLITLTNYPKESRKAHYSHIL